ncbi:ATP-binding protein [Serratia nevei]|uniref:AlbA family DNA-binding domain-containing protein n=1 Tax=Serratia TaxID=613 RepID=UPI00313D9FDF
MSKNNFYAEPAVYHKPISEIDTDTINELYKLEEGWFVEFKSNLPEGAKIAKSISSFANAHGGIIIYGAIEDQKTRKLKELKGFDVDTAEENLIKIRQSVESHIMPCPYYQAEKIKTSEDKDEYIIWVRVPKGKHVPYLHGSGVIYTRKGDSSSPTALTDISVLERLWQDGYREREKLANRIKHLMECIPKSFPSIDIFIKHEDFGFKDNDYVLSFNDFKKLALEPAVEGVQSFLDVAHPMDGSFVARKRHKDVGNISIKWEFDRANNLHHIRIPLAVQFWGKGKLNDSYLGKADYSKLSEYFNNNGITSDVFIVDMSYAIGMLSILVRKVFMLHEITGDNGRLYLNAKVSGVKNSMAIVNYNKYYEELNNSVFPFIFRDPDFLYPIDEITSWMNLVVRDKENDDLGKAKFEIANTSAIFVEICHCLGITFYSVLGNGESVDGGDDDLSELVENLSGLLIGNYSYTSMANPSYS